MKPNCTLRRLFWICALLPAVARADYYSCKDSSGHLLTSDQPIPECAEKSTQVYKDSGVLKNQLTPVSAEQRHIAERQEQQRVLAERQNEQNKKEQRYLLTHYPTEQDVELARKKAMDAIEAKLTTEKLTLATTTAALNKLRSEQSHIPANQPSKLMESKYKEIDLNQTLKQSEHLIHNYQIEQVNTTHDFDETHKRYQEIVLAH